MDLFMLPRDIRCRVLSLLFGAVKIHVVVQFYPWYNFDFPLFFSMLIGYIYIYIYIYNEYQTKENQN